MENQVQNHTTPLKAIREKCIDCSGWSLKEVSLCCMPECSLYPYRFGKSPFRKKRDLSQEEREAVALRLHGGRAKKK
jgi:hypothetical protein